MSHARHVLEAKLTEEVIVRHAEEIPREAAAAELPFDLENKVIEPPELSWDQALERIVNPPAIMRSP